MVVWLTRSNSTQSAAGEQNNLKAAFSKTHFSHFLSLRTSVPRVVAVRPRQLGLEAVEQVEERPGQDDDVVHAAVQDHHLAGVAQTCGDKNRAVTHWNRLPEHLISTSGRVQEESENRSSEETDCFRWRLVVLVY